MEIKRVLKPNGIAFLGVMNIWGTAHEYLTKIILPVAIEDNEKVMQTGNLHPSAFTTSDHHCHLFTAKKLKNHTQSADFQRLTIFDSNYLSALRAEFLED